MDKTKVTTELLCSKCNDNTLHEVTYIGPKISKIVCTNCNKEYHINPEEVYFKYLSEIIKDIKSKPKKISEELKKDFGKSVINLPKRIITKPFRIIKDYRKIKKQVEE